MTNDNSNDEREQRILDAAADLILHYGYDKTTVSDIAREAGVSKGAIYLHFDSKKTLFDALLQREINAYSERWLNKIEADPQGGTFVGLYRAALESINESPLMTMLFKQDKRILGNYLRLQDNIFSGRTHMRTDFVRMMQDVGAIRPDIAPEIVAHIMNVAAYGILLIDDFLPPEDIPDYDAVMDGIAKIFQWALTPDNENASDAGKQVIRQMLQAARAQLRQQSDTDDPST